MREGLAWLELVRAVTIIRKPGSLSGAGEGITLRGFWPATSPTQAHHALVLARDAGDRAVLPSARRMWLRRCDTRAALAAEASWRAPLTMSGH